MTDDVFETFRHTFAMGSVEVSLPRLTDDLPTKLKEAIARRRTLALTGRCPCGVTLADAELSVIDRGEDNDRSKCTIVSVTHHAPGCPAADVRVNALARAHVESLVQRVIDEAPPVPPVDAS